MDRKKVLGFWDLVFFSFCAIFGVEAIATSAAIGPSAVSWWLIFILGYFLPYGLITAELGSTYPGQGGIYVWIKRALGRRWAARSSWYYWIGLPIWLPAIYIAISEILGHLFFPEAGLWSKISFGIVLIWIAVGINLCPLSISKWFPNLGTATRLLLVGGLIFSAIMFLVRNGQPANHIDFMSMLPNKGMEVVFIPVILYNLMGCELVSSAAGEMKNPVRDVPRAIILSALAIAVLYLITAFTVWIVVPVSEINVSSGLLQVFTRTFGDFRWLNVILVVAGFLISFTLFAEIIAWNLGQNRTVAEAAKNGDLPRILGTMTKSMAPVGASLMSGAISTAVIIIYGLIANNASELFWNIISFSLVIGLFSDLMLFPSFIVLRIRDKEVQRPYRLPGPDWFAVCLAVLAEFFILTAVIILLIQPGQEFIKSSLPIIVGVVLTAGIGELFVSHSMRKTVLR